MNNTPENKTEQSGENAGQNTWTEAMADVKPFDKTEAEEMKAKVTGTNKDDYNPRVNIARVTETSKDEHVTPPTPLNQGE